MKSILILAITSLSLSGLSFTTAPHLKSSQVNVTTQTTPVQEMFTYFRTHRQGSGVSVNWGISTSSEVAGFRVERSYDNDFFETVNDMPCGSALKFTWNDEFVFPGYIYYRIVCIMKDGTTHMSDVNSVRIVKHG